MQLILLSMNFVVTTKFIVCDVRPVITWHSVSTWLVGVCHCPIYLQHYHATAAKLKLLFLVQWVFVEKVPLCLVSSLIVTKVRHYGSICRLHHCMLAPKWDDITAVYNCSRLLVSWTFESNRSAHRCPCCKLHPLTVKSILLPVLYINLSSPLHSYVHNIRLLL